MHKTSDEEINKRIGEIRYNNQGYRMKIINYRLYTDIDVIFDDGYICNTSYGHFKEGKVKDLMSPSVYGKGIIGEINIKGREKIKAAWLGIMQRSFSECHKTSYPTYKNVTSCDEWLYFPNFVRWVESQNNWEIIKNYKWQVDKDILYKNNLIYTPDKCVLVTNNVNSLFVKKDRNRGNYPIGVTKRKSRYSSCCRNPYGKPIEHHGFKTPEDAFYQYKKDKESVIKKVADDEYSKGKITKKCYEAMINYEVSIND